MIKTKMKNPAKALDKFFHNEMLPVAEKLKSQQGDFFPLGPDDNASSYYIDRKCSKLTRADFEDNGCDSVESLQASLSKLWQSQDQSALVELTPSISELAAALRQVEEEQKDVSEFIYVMY